MKLDYIDPEKHPDISNNIHQVSAYVAGQAFNDICRMIGGRWPDEKMKENAPFAYTFFMELLE